MFCYKQYGLQQMKKQILLTFLGVNKTKSLELKCDQDLDYPTILSLVDAERKKWEDESKIRHLKAYLKIQDPQQASPPKYLRMDRKDKLNDLMQIAYSHCAFEVEYFCPKNEDSYKKIIMNIGIDLDEIKRCLSTLTSELKDEVNQINLPNIIRRNTSKDEEVIEVFLVVCDPLVQSIPNEKDAYHPLYHDQIDATSHVERLRKASLSNSDLTIKVSRVLGTPSNLNRVLSHSTRLNSQNHLFSVVQIFTRVQRREGKVMLSLESEQQEGSRDWVAAERVLGSELSANVVIVVGVGAWQLLQEQLGLGGRLICISTISMEEKRILANIDERNPLDNENSYNDHYSQLFVEEFYTHLFRRHRIQESYDHAHQLAKNHLAKNIWCCCLHNHYVSCPWNSIIAKIGEPEAHRLFKHSFSDWAKADYYMNTLKLQLLLSGGKQEQLRTNGGIWTAGCCPGDNICCWQLMKVQSKKALHTNLSKFIGTNGKEPDQQFYAHIQHRFQRSNRFEAQTYDKPIGIRPPLTIFLAVKHIKEHPICILRSQTLSQAKKLFQFAKEYIKVRSPCLEFFEFKISSQSRSFKEELRQQVEQAKRKSGEHMGASIKSRTQHIYVWAVHNRVKYNQYYEKLMEEYWNFAKEEPKVKLKFILLIDNKSFSSLQVRASLLLGQSKPRSLHLDAKMQIQVQLDDNHPSQRYHSVLSRHSYSHIIDNISLLQNQILQGQLPQRQYPLNFNDFQNTQSKLRLQFLGFLSQFGKEGFYVTKVTHVILCELFDKSLVDEAVNNQLPVVNIQVGDSTYLQLNKNCLQQFASRPTNQKLEYLSKKLQFYYVLMRLYFQLWPLPEAVHYPAPIRHYLSKEGIFSIDIVLQSPNYEAQTNSCKQEILKRPELSQTLFNMGSTSHIYHLHQIELILQELVKKKKNKHNPGSKSFIDDRMFSTFQYLVWNIIHKSWLMAQVLSKTNLLNIDHFQSQIISFLEKVEISLPISAVGAIQISILMNRPPPTLKENQFGRLTHLIGKYRHYAYKKQILESLQPKWGKLQQFKDSFGNCFHLALTIGSLIDPSESLQKGQKQRQDVQGVRDELRIKQKMFSSSNAKAWRLQCLKLIERKVLYYFSFTNELKKNQTLREFREKSNLFDNYFKLGQISYEFKNFKRNIMKEALQAKNTHLIELYLGVQLGEYKAEPDTKPEIDNKTDLEAKPEADNKLEARTKPLAKSLGYLKGHISPEYMPIFTYLYQQLQRKTIFNQKDLVIFARARNILYEGKPYVYIRKRTLLTQYLGKVLRTKALKVSYFSLTEQTLNIFQKSQNNNCEVLCMILTVDSTADGYIMFGSEEGVGTVPMTLASFAQKIKKCRIKMLIICGKNSRRVCDQLKKNQMQSSGQQSYFPSVSASMIKSKITQNTNMTRSKLIQPAPIDQEQAFPTLIAIENTQYHLCDSHIFEYSPPQEPIQSQTEPNTRHSLFNRQPSNYEESNAEIEIFSNQNFFKDITQDESMGLSQESSNNLGSVMDVVDTFGRVIFPQVSLKKAESQSQEDDIPGIEKYIRNEVNQIGMDLIVITIVKSITSQLKDNPKVFQENELNQVLKKSVETVKNILANRFECAREVFENIEFAVWSNRHHLPKINEGEYQDLTKNFYCAENNLNDQHYYENIGNCEQVGQAMDLLGKRTNCIEILGGNPTTKANLLQELCWISQTKSLFKFGIIKLDLREDKLSRLSSKEFADRQSNSTQARLLIAIDNVELLNLSHAQNLSRLKGKLFTLLYTTSSAQKGEELRQLLQLRDYNCIDLDKRSQQQLNNEVYASLLCQVKQKNEFMFDRQKLKGFEDKVQDIMKIVQAQKKRERLSKALELLRGLGRSQEERNNSFLHFYQQHFEELLNTLLHVRELTIKFK